MQNNFIQLLLLFVLFFLPQTSTATSNPAITAGEKAKTIEALVKTLSLNYIFTKKSQILVDSLQNKQKNGGYRDFRTARAFARQLTLDLQAFSGDLHFYVEFNPDWISDQRKAEDPAVKKALAEEQLREEQIKNFGFETVDILEGNIGYIKMSHFADPDIGHKAAAAAMKFVENSDALIFDMRHNNGGYLEMVQLILSYLFTTEEPQTLYEYYYLEDGKRIEKADWVLPFVPGPRLPDKPVYVLTSNATFSAAEWFAYILKDIGRATIVGEQTAGGAHPVDRKIIDDRFLVQVPIGEAKGPVSKSDFEGVGVKPDIAVAAHMAANVAHRNILEALIKLRPQESTNYSWILPKIEAGMHPQILTAAEQEALAGQYEGRRIIVEGNTIWYRWGSRFQVRLLPLATDLLGLEGVKDFRFQVIRQNGKISGLRRIYANGNSLIHKRLEQ